MKRKTLLVLLLIATAIGAGLLNAYHTEPQPSLGMRIKIESLEPGQSSNLLAWEEDGDIKAAEQCAEFRSKKHQLAFICDRLIFVYADADSGQLTVWTYY